MALKVDFGDDDAHTSRFQGELLALQKASHPSLIDVLDHGAASGRWPCFPGDAALAGRDPSPKGARSPLDPKAAMELIRSLAGALGHLHDLGLVHRDVKPENIMLTESGKVVLLDLGLARNIEDSASTTTARGLVRGTPAYTAPERFFGTPANVRTDVYELALVFYFSVAGRVPWTSDDPQARLHPTPPSELGSPCLEVSR